MLTIGAMVWIIQERLFGRSLGNASSVSHAYRLESYWAGRIDWLREEQTRNAFAAVGFMNCASGNDEHRR